MSINWQDVLISVFTAVGGASVFLLAAAWLIKAVITDRLKANADREIERVKNTLAQEAKAFEMQLKASADIEIERLKAFLVRASRVHERQLDILSPMYMHLSKAQWFFQRMTAAGRFEGEQTPEQYEPLCSKSLEAAYDVFLPGRLLIPSQLAQHCDRFFDAVFEGRRDFSLAHHPSIDPVKRAGFWTAAANVAHQQVPKILLQIEEVARGVIHGEPD